MGLHWQTKRPGPGVRCWTLVARSLAQGAGIDVPDYEGAETAQAELVELQTVRQGSGEWPWVTVVARNEPDRVARALQRGREFDVAVFRRKGLHAGILTAPGEMLHIEEGGLSHLINFNTGVWRACFLALYRHVELA